MCRRLGKRGCWPLAIMVLIVALYLANTIFFRIHLNIFNPQRLPDAISTWESKGIESYRITFDVSIALLRLIKTRYNLVIEGGEIVDAGMKPVVSLANPNYDPDSEVFTPVNLADLDLIADYTVDKLFQQVSDWIRNYKPIELRDDWIDIEYDPEYGYINFMQGQCSSLSDCSYYYKVIEFEPLPE